MDLNDIKLNPEEFAFYTENLKTNPKGLIFKKDQVDFSYKKIAIQLQSRNNCIKKLPNWTSNLKITYPKKISLEQCSSERTASFKQSLLPKGHNFADITGGFGVDTACLAKNYTNSEYFELNSELATIVKDNFKQLELDITVNNTNGVNHIVNNTKVYDLIYLDPARRKADKKVFRLEDCTPNLIEHQSDLLDKTTYLFSKHSPLLDLIHIQQTLKAVKAIYVISVLNECKEILVVQEKTFVGDTEIYAVNLLADQKMDLQTSLFKERQSVCPCSDEDHKYIYIPNSSILKSGLSETVALQYGLKKFSSNTHFYLSNTLHNNYPGRCFEVTMKAHKIKAFKKLTTKQKRDVICRNSSYKPDDLAKKLNLIRGNDEFFILSGKNNNQTTYFFDSKRIF